MLTIAIVFLTGAVTLYLYVQDHKKKLSQKIGEVGLDMKSEFENEITSIVPHLHPRCQIFSEVESFGGGWMFWNKDLRVLLTIKLQSSTDLETVQPMMRKFVKEYLSRSENRKYRAKVVYTTYMKGDLDVQG